MVRTFVPRYNDEHANKISTLLEKSNALFDLGAFLTLVTAALCVLFMRAYVAHLLPRTVSPELGNPNPWRVRIGRRES